MKFHTWWLNEAGRANLSCSGGDAEHIWNNAIKHNCNEGWNAALEHAREEFLQREIDHIGASTDGAEFWEKHYAETLRCRMDWQQDVRAGFRAGLLKAALEYLKEQK